MSGTAGGTQILREFLMRLGYAEDESSRRKFTDAIHSMTLTVAGLGAAVVAAAAGVIAGVRQMASGAEQLYFTSQRTKSSARDIGALKEAFENLGGTAGQAQAALERMAEKIKASPGIKSYIESLTGGKQYKDAATAMEDLSEAFQQAIESGTDISVIFKQAENIGLTTADVYVLLQKDFKATAEEYREMADRILGDSDRQQEITKRAYEFMKSYRALRQEVNLFAEGFADTMYTKLKPSIDAMREYLVNHTKEINAFLLGAANVISEAIARLVRFGEAASRAVGALIGWYDKLTPTGKLVAETIAGVATAIFLMNTAIGKSPVVRLLALAAGLVELYNDYQHWKETGETGIVNWEKWEPAITKATAAVKEIVEWIRSGVEAVGGWEKALTGFAAFIGTVWAASTAIAMGKAVVVIMAALSPLLSALAAIAVGVAAYKAGSAIAHYIDDTMSENDKAEEFAKSKGFTLATPGRPTGGYKDQGGKYYTNAELAAMYNRTRGPDSAAQAQAAKEGYDQYIAMGATPAVAAAMIAQEKAESAFDPGARGDNGAAGGLYQHHKDRRDAIMAGTGIDMWNSTAANQRRGAWWELHHGESDAFNKMMEAGDNPGVAGAAGSTAYERPADRNEQAALRAQLAREYYNAFKTAPAMPLPPPVPPVGTLLQAPPPLLPGAAHGAANDDHSNTTIHQTNHIHLGDIGGHDPNHVATLIGGSVRQHTQTALSQAARNGTANVV